MPTEETDSLRAENNQQQQCRICLSTSGTDSDLIEPCGCSGTLRYVHFECLKEWISTSGHSGCGVCGTKPYTGVRIHKTKCGLVTYIEGHKLLLLIGLIASIVYGLHLWKTTVFFNMSHPNLSFSLQNILKGVMGIKFLMETVAYICFLKCFIWHSWVRRQFTMEIKRGEITGGTK